MRFQTVIFDLHGTLVFSPPGWGEEMDAEVAAALGAPARDFVREWGARGYRRTIGACASPGDCIEEVCRALGLTVTPEQIERAVATRLACIRRNLLPRPGAVDLLRRLRDMGLKTGLLSNCDPDIPIIWLDMPFHPLIDDAVFSCKVGMAKPQREIFELACRRLATPAERCVYVADGAGDELETAQSRGIYAVRLRPMEGEPSPEGADRWHGPAIDALPQLLDLIQP